MEKISSQHLINIFVERDSTSYFVSKFNKISAWLKNDGVCTEENCQFLGIRPTFFKLPRGPFFRAAVCVEKKNTEFTENELIQWVNEGPVLGVVCSCLSLRNLGAGAIWRGAVNPGAYHTLVIDGYGTDKVTDENGLDTYLNYWSVRNSYGGNWSSDGYGKIMRLSSLQDKHLSLFESIWFPKDIVRSDC